ncbi:hypothetical protein [Allobranchiibius sp. GilTou73]|uniref:hypothetical protein n=1 Tax=Allobranchiibius sp. GilTou73 TaxID=2904523 RepID=UPI001F33D4BC|nr:hypothetical protein [Allobranchiibius sp. GilTou73]UIJ34371.1 hypothetical protein LVQ62_14825 [Allobranchiibius sp. GilTou73]
MRTRTTLLGCAAVASSAGLLLTSAPGASADTVWTLRHNATATTYIKAMNKSVTTTGTQTAQFDLTNRKLTAVLNLAPTSTDIKLAGLPLAKATIAIENVGKATGTIDYQNKVSVTQRVNLHITSLNPLGLPVNLVGNDCKTSTPVTLNLTGKVTGLFDPFSLSGTFSIPKFAGCGLATPAVSALTSGDGNTVKVDYVVPK